MGGGGGAGRSSGRGGMGPGMGSSTDIGFLSCSETAESATSFDSLEGAFRGASQHRLASAGHSSSGTCLYCGRKNCAIVRVSRASPCSSRSTGSVRRRISGGSSSAAGSVHTSPRLKCSSKFCGVQLEPSSRTGTSCLASAVAAAAGVAAGMAFLARGGERQARADGIVAACADEAGAQLWFARAWWPATIVAHTIGAQVLEKIQTP